MMRAIPRSAIVVIAVTAGVVATASCSKEPPKPAAERPATAAAATPAPKATPWYVGEWTGTYQASVFKIDMTEAQGAVKEWAKDDPDALSGSGTLTLSVAEDRRVSGKAGGPLGELVASGEVDGETLRVALKPAEAAPADRVTSATLIATRRGDGFEGQLRASTGNSLKVRVATLSLTKQGGATPAAAPAPSKT
jgi:hypothetical protein